MKAFTTIISILLISISLSLSAQNAPITTLGTISSTALSASVPITAVGFTNISSCALKIVYDPLIATPTNVSIGVGLGGTFDYNIATPGVIIIGWYTTNSLVTLNNSSTLFNISFNKITNGTTNLNFVDDSNGRACKYTTVVGGVSQTLNDSPLSTYYVPGALTFTNQGPATIAPTLTASVNDNISVPVTVTGFNNVGVVSLTLDYDPAVLSFISGSNTPGGFPNLSFDGTSVPGTIYIGGLESSVTGTTLTDFFTLFTLNFTYLGGTTTLIWNNDYAVNCEYAGSYPDNLTLNDEPYVDYYINGSVGPNPLPTTPTIAVGAITNPNTCGGNGTIPLTFTNVPNETYVISYTGGTFPGVVVTGGAATISAPAGTYNNLQITVNSVTSATGISATVTDPALPTQPTITAGGLTTFCEGGSVTLTSSAGSSYLWSTGATTQSITVNAAGSYWVKVKNAAGCESVQSLSTVVTVNALPTQPTITAGGLTTFCEGGSVTLTSSAGSSYLWSTGATTQSITVNAAGSYWVKVKNAAGCESVQSLSIEVTVTPEPVAVVTNKTICSDETYTWSVNNVTYSGAAGSTTVTVEGENCAADQTLNLTVTPEPVAVVTNKTICSDETYTWSVNNVTYSGAAGSTTVTVEGENCAADQTLNLTVTPEPVAVVTNKTICSDETYTWSVNNVTYSGAAGSTTVTVEGENCAADQTLNLTVTPEPVAVVTNKTICSDETYTWSVNNVTYSGAAGSTTVTVEGENCAADQTLNLTVTPEPVAVVTNKTICSDETYTWSVNNVTYSGAAGSTTVTVEGENCAADQTLNLTVTPEPVAVVTNKTICSDETYTWSVNNVTYSGAAGSTTVTVEGENCAADQTLNLTVTPEPVAVVTNKTICSDETYTWSVNNVTYSGAAGSTTVTVEGENCAADQTLNLTVTPEPVAVVTNKTICSDETYTWSVNNVTYSGAAGSTTVTVEGENCAADQTLNLTVTPEPVAVVTNKTICSDETYTWSVNNVTYSGAAGSTTVTVEGENCAADQTLNLTVTPEPVAVVTNKTICSDETYTWSVNNVTYSGAAGSTTVTVEGENCAADQTLNLTVTPEPVAVVTNKTICSDETYTWSVNNVTYSGAAGSTTVTVEGENCAADQTLNLTVTPEPVAVITTVNICSDESYTWSVNGETYTTAQNITIEGENCAADQTLNLTVTPEPVAVVTNKTICSDETYTWSVNNVTYSGAAGSTTVTVEGENCAADQTLNLTVTPEPVAVVTNKTICSDETYTWSVNNVTYSGAAGSTTVTVEGENCAADQTLNLTVTPEPVAVVTNKTICSDETYTWSVNNVTYSGAAGSTTVTVEGENCAADQTLNLTVTPEPVAVVTNKTICSDETYTWSVNNVTYSGAAGSTTVTVEGENCAADQTLNLTVTPEPVAVITTVNICSDESYTWSVNGETYTTAQNITIEGENCAADQTLNLTVTDNPVAVVTNKTICSDETYTWSVNNVTYSGAAGSTTVTVEGENCAADQTLNLTVTPEPVAVVTNKTICSDETYTWSVNNVTYSGAAGSTTVTVEGENCAADQTLNLTVTPEPVAVVTNKTICSDETYTWSVNNVTYSGAAGSTTVTVEGENCAADQTLNLTVTPEPVAVVTNKTICSDETYTWSVNNVTYSGAAGSTTVTVEGENCAADQTLNLTVTPEPVAVITTVNICSDESYTWSVNGETYTTAQNITIEGENCAADQTLNLTVTDNPVAVVTNKTICSDETYTWSVNNVTYSGAAGSTTVTVEGENCAADQTLNLTVTPEPVAVITTVNICSDESYTWSVNGETYTTAQNITIEGENCAADQTLNLTVTDNPVAVVTNKTICSDETYTWSVNNVTYSGAAGSTTVTVEGENCAADQTLNLTVTPEPVAVVTNKTICSDETYTWSVNNVTYSGAAGSTTVTVEGENCAADQTLNLTVTPEPVAVVTNKTICSDETYTWSVNNVTYSGAAGSTTVTVEGENCAADQTLNLTVTPEPVAVVTNKTICSDETYTWSVNNVTYSGAAGSTTVTVEGENCAADQTLNLTVTPEPVAVVTNKTICSDETYTWSVNNVTYSGAAGSTTVTVEGENCAADQTLNLTVTPEPVAVVTNKTICSDETYTWSVNNVTYSGAAGSTTVTVEGENCAADQTLNLTVTPEPVAVVTNKTICSDETYTWSVNNVTYSGAAGSTTVTVEGENCAADQTLNLTVTPEPVAVVTNKTICSDETYTWSVNNVTYSGAAGSTTVTVEGENCAADQTLNLTVTPEPVAVITTVNICSDESYTWSVNGETYTTAQNITIEGENCAADQTLNLTVTDNPVAVVTNKTICSDETYTWSVNNVTYSGAAGSTTVTVEGENCAADQTLNLTVTPEPVAVVTNKTICSDETYTWSVNNVTYSGAAGSTTVTVEGENCAADQTLNLTVTPEPVAVVTNKTICSDETYTWSVNNVTYSGAAGSTTVTVEGENCAADQTLNLTVTPEPVAVVTNKTICSDETYTWSVNNVTYSGAAGSTTVTVEGENCAADQTLNLTVTPEPVAVVTNKTICSDETYTWSVNNVTYSGAAGSTTVTVEGENCAADQTLNLTVTPEPVAVVTNKTICSDETYTWSVNNVTYSGAAGSTTVTVEGENCAADQTLNLTVTPEPVAVITTVNICSDESYTWSVNGETYTTAQNITIEGENCAADQTLNLTVTDNPVAVVTNKTICSDETYTWSVNNVTYSGAAGSTTVTVEGENCAADQTLNLTVTPEPVAVVTNKTICSDETYTWSVNNVTYSGAAGSTTVTVEGENCAADQTLNLTVTPEPVAVVTNKTICSDETYTWSVNNVTYSGAAGSTTVTVEGENCAADQTLNLTVTPEPVAVVTNKTICSDETYTWSVNNVTYSGAAGSTTVTVEGENCAADQTLNLTVTPEPVAVITTVNICSDESYTWSVNGETYTTAQNITIEGENCAADQTLNLTVTDNPVAVVTNKTICSDETYTWSVNNVTYSGAAGSTTVTVEGENCAADQTLNLTVTPEPVAVITTVNICSDESYTWSVNGETYTTAQNITIEGENCAADQTLNLTVTPEPVAVVTNKTICSDETYTWSVNNVTYSGAAGSTTVTVEGENCAADQTLNLTVTPEPVAVVTNKTICSDETYTWSVNNVTYSGAAGSTTVTVEGENCAADQTLNLTVTPEPVAVITTVNICSDESYTWSVNGETYTTAQNITIEGENCAADQTLNLTVTDNPVAVVTNKTICSDETYTWSVNNVTYSGAAGSTTVTVEGENCAADQTLNLTVTPEPVAVVTNKTICSDETYTWSVNNVTYSGAAGSTTVTVEGENCAADQTLNLTVTPEPVAVVTNKTICSDETYTWSVNNVTYSGAAGSTTVTVEGENCAADQTLNLTVTPEPVAVVTNKTICSDETYTWSVNNVTYSGAAGSTTVTVEGENCAADQTLNLTVTPEPVAVVTNKTICSDETYTWSVNNVTYSGAAGSTTVTVEGENCAADQTLNLTVTPEPVAVVTNKTICSDETYTWSVNNVTYSGAAGSTTVTVEGENCAADQTLNLTVTPSSDNITIIEACDSYIWNGTEYTATGLYRGTTTDCVTEVLDLTITPIPPFPTGLECWETATWTPAVCDWVITGTQPATPTITPNGPTEFYQGGSVTLTSSTGYSYLWSTGETTQSIVVNASGSFWVKVIDEKGCESEQSTPVTVNVLPVNQDCGGSVLGNTEVYSSVSYSPRRYAIPVTFAESGTINCITIYHNGGTGKVLTGVYADNTGTPTTLLGKTIAANVNSSEGWQTISLINPVEVQKGETVWLTWVFENNPGVRETTGTPNKAYSFDTWSNGMPDAFGHAYFANFKYSVYCNYTPKIEATNIGNTDIYGNTIKWGAQLAMPVTFSEAGEITSISIYHDGGTGSMLLGVYSDQGGFPSSRLAKTAITTVNPVAGWQTIQLPTPLQVVSGQKVWLSWVFQTVPAIHYTTGTPGRAASSNTWANQMPTSFGTSTIAPTKYSIYCTFSTQGSLPDGIAPVVTAFNIPSASASLTVPVSSFTATDNKAVTGYKLTESATAPLAGDAGWNATAPVSYDFATSGTKTLYAWAKDAAGNVSAGISAQVIITLPDYNIGNTDIYGSTIKWGAQLAMPVTFSEAGEITSISIYHDGGTGSMLLGVYSDQGGFPSSRLAKTAITTVNPVAGWQTIQLPTTLQVVSGQKVWLSWVFQTVPAIHYTTGTPGRAASSNTWANQMPASFGTSTIAPTKYSIYCTFSTQGSLPDGIAPVVTAFNIPSASASLTVPVSSFTATDNKAVTGYKLTESATAPLAGDAGWNATAPVSYDFATSGTKTLYAWAKDAAGNVSAGISAQVIITLPDYNIGNTDIYGNTIKWGAQLAMPVTFSEAGEITSISIYHDGGTGSMLLGVYSDQGGFPTTRLAKTAITTVNPVSGWQTIQLPTPLQVVSGQKVWLSWVFQTVPAIHYTTGTPGRAASSNTWANQMPTSFGTSTIAPTKYSIYCTYTTTKSAEIATSVIPDVNLSDLRVYPNPFSDRLHFEFVSPESVNARIDLYDLTGRMIKTIFEQPVESGVSYEAEFRPETIISGMYIYRFTIGQKVTNGKVIFKKE